MKKRVWKYFSESFNLLWKQPIIIVPLLINLILGFVILSAAEVVSSSNPIMQNYISDIQQYTATGAVPSFSMEALYSLIAVYAVAGIIWWLINSFIMSGTIGMIYDIARKKKTSLNAAMNYGKKFFLRFIGVGAVLTLLFLAGAAIVLLPVLIDMTWITVIIAIVLAISLALFLVLFFLSTSYLIIGDKGVFASIGKSISVVKSNYFRSILLLILFTACGALINLIPYAGMLISQVIIGAASGIAIVLFALDNR